MGMYMIVSLYACCNDDGASIPNPRWQRRSCVPYPSLTHSVLYHLHPHFTSPRSLIGSTVRVRRLPQDFRVQARPQTAHEGAQERRATFVDVWEMRAAKRVCRRASPQLHSPWRDERPRHEGAGEGARSEDKGWGGGGAGVEKNGGRAGRRSQHVTPSIVHGEHDSAAAAVCCYDRGGAAGGNGAAGHHDRRLCHRTRHQAPHRVAPPHEVRRRGGEGGFVRQADHDA